MKYDETKILPCDKVSASALRITQRKFDLFASPDRSFSMSMISNEWWSWLAVAAVTVVVTAACEHRSKWVYSYITYCCVCKHSVFFYYSNVLAIVYSILIHSLTLEVDRSHFEFEWHFMVCQKRTSPSAWFVYFFFFWIDRTSFACRWHKMAAR